MAKLATVPSDSQFADVLPACAKAWAARALDNGQKTGDTLTVTDGLMTSQGRPFSQTALPNLARFSCTTSWRCQMSVR